MTLRGALLAVIAGSEEACQARAAPLRDAGAIVQTAVVHVDALAALSAPGFDAAVLDVGTDPESFVVLLAGLREDPRTRALPIVVLPSSELASGRLARLGMVTVIADADADDAGSGARPAWMEPLGQLVVQRRAAAEASDRSRTVEDRLRVALERVGAMRADAQTLAHDARVLCGVAVGFAANLRDGLAGPLSATQLGHVGQILDAVNDAGTMLERFDGAARAHADLPNMTVKAAAPGRTSRRSWLDLAELAGTTLKLFENVAAKKALTTRLDAPEPVFLWCDAMQIKQVVTNLLVNALKFTPAGGAVTLMVRSAQPPRAPGGAGRANGANGRAGPSRRHHAELVVEDTGPGIPPGDRERVFERGVRLGRDAGISGSGVGLAVVRELVGMHGGSIHAQQSPGGGASFVVSLPLDMRARTEPSILLVDDARAARQVVAALRGQRNGREAVSGGRIAAALESCRAVVVVPLASRGALDDLLEPNAAPVAVAEGGRR